MIEIKYGYGVHIAATLYDSFGDALSLQRCRGIEAVLINPNHAQFPASKVTYNEYSNVVHIYVSPKELGSEGTYQIAINVIAERRILASVLTPVVAVSPNANAGHADISMDMRLSVVDYPASVKMTGASPKISKNNTWLIFDDRYNAYVDTFIPVGYADLVSRYDAKYAEILSPAIEAADSATAAAEKAETAAQTATDAAEAAQKAADAASETELAKAVEEAQAAIANISLKVEETETGAKVTAVDKDGNETTAEIANGKDGADGADGKDGSDGVDGKDGDTIALNDADDGVEIVVNHSDGTIESKTVTNGQDGQDGAQGEKGEKGDQGEKGDTGEKGEQGEKGDQGEKGADGKDGVSPTVDVAETDTGVDVKITDAEGEKTFSLTNGKDGKDGADGADGAQGEQGPQGEQGIQGEKGDQGDPGKDGDVISLTETDEGVEIKTTHYDGTYETATVYNGKDGKDGQDGSSGGDADIEEISIEEIDELFE